MPVPKLSAAEQKFIVHWGEMGARWGVNRTIAQIHALLYLSPEPVTAEEIATTLSVARSNVSTSLKELQHWDLVNVAHELGDRRDRYTSKSKDVWELFKLVMEGRRQREVDPTVTMLRSCLQELETSGTRSPYTEQRLKEMLEFLETMSGLYEQVRGMPREQLEKLVKLGGKLNKFLGILG
jgi:DNA-binding transcriptional regulator GbsR (MarR family)